MKTLKVIRGKNRYGLPWNDVYLDGQLLPAVFSVTALELANGKFYYTIVPMADSPILTGEVTEVSVEERMT